MAAELNIQIGANVGDAVQGLGFVAERTKKLQDSIAFLRSKLADTKSEKFYANALGIIAQKQAELNKISRATGDVLGKTVNNTQKATQSLTDLSRIAQDAPYGFTAIANNLNPLVESFGRLKTSTGSTSGALKALAAGLTGPAGIGLAVGVASSLLVKFGDDLFGAGKAAEKAKSDSDKLKDSINGIFGEVAKEATQVTSFVAVLKSETETRQRKLQAIKELQQIQPDIFRGLKLEGDQVVGLTSSYNAYLESLKTVVAAKIKQAQLDQVIEKLLKAQGVTLTDQEQTIVNFGNEISKAYGKQIAGSVAGAQYAEKQKKQTQAQTNEIKNLNAEVERLTKDLTELSKGVKLGEISAPKIKDSDKLITRAKALAKELAKIGAVVPEFSETQTKAQQEQIAKDFIARFKGAKLEFNVTPIIKADKIEMPPLTDGVGMSEAEKQAEKDGAILGQAFIDGRNKVLTTGFILTPEALKARNIQAAIEAAIKLGKDGAQAVNEAINSIKLEGLFSIGEALGAAFSGNEIKNVFQSFVTAISGAIVALGKQLVTLGIAAKVTKDALKTLFSNPIAMVAAGVGLIAVGSAIRGALSKGIEGREKGGPVTGNTPYIVGERGPELFVPSVGGSIIPNNRMTSFTGRPAFAMGGGGGRTIVRGNDILLASARTQRSQNRVNA